MPAALFFDLYGVLADSHVMSVHYRRRQGEILRRQFGGSLDRWLAIHDEAWDRYMQEGARLDGLPDSQREGSTWVRAVERMEEDILRFRFERAGVPPPQDPLKFAHALEEAVVRGIDAMYPDVRPILRALKADGYGLYLSTNATRSNAEPALVGGGVRDLFDGLVMLEVARAKKDRPSYWRRAFEVTDVRPSDAVVVDDVATYLAPAAQLGSRCVQVLRRGGARQEEGRWPVIHTLTALPALL